MLTEELVALAGITRAPNAEELGRVEAWLADAFPAETLRAVIELKRRQPNYKPPATLLWFDGAMRDTRKPNGRGPAAPVPRSPAAPASTPLSDAGQAIRSLLKPCQDAWLGDRSCPFPPSLEEFKTACAADSTRALAQGWREAWGAWDKAGRPSDQKPPSFSSLAQNRAVFEQRMLEIEEALTRPAPPDTS